MQQAIIKTVLGSLLAVALVLATEHHHEEDHHSSYKFAYGVEDHHTGDIKSHHEHRHGKEVSGIYTMKEADGTTRIVKYHAGPHKGFHAEVERIGHAQHPAHYGHHKSEAHQGGTSHVGTTHFGYKDHEK